MLNNFEGNPFSKEKGPKDGDCTNNPRPHSFVTLSSGKCAGKNSSSASAISNENVSSTAIFNGNSKNTENSMQSSDAQDVSAKSEVEIRDVAQRTESSCSNSYFVHPVCSSNDNYQETSMEAKSSLPNGSSNVVPTSGECIIKEPMTGIVASVTHHARDKEEYCNKVDHALVPPKKGTEAEDTRDNKACNKQDDKSRSLYPKEDPESTLEGRKILAVEKEYVAVEEMSELVHRFDLNDDIPRSANVIRPMAKLGVPLCFPTSIQKFEGELGWRGTAATSAFCMVPFPKSTDENYNSRASNIIDLNLTAEEAEFPWASEKKPTFLHFSDSKQVEKFSIDLNAPSDNSDDCPFPVHFTNRASMDFNLNDDPAVREACDHIQLQRNHTHGAIPSLPTKRHLNILGPVLNHIPVFNHGRGQPFLVAAPNLPMDRLARFVPVQPQLSPYAMQVVPSYCYPSNGSFLIAQPDSLPTHNLCYGALPPHTRDLHGHAVFPRVLNAGGVPSFPGAPYLMGQAQSGGTDLQPRYDNGSWKENTTRQFLTPSLNTERNFSQQAITPTKRREPEGGWDAYQLSLKHMPSSR